MEQLKAKESPLPRVPQACVNALVGNNPFGQAFLYSGEFPEREKQCFLELSGKLPMCTLDEWPIPIVGSWLSAFSCIYGSGQDFIQPLFQDAANGELDMLNECIPQEITAADCKEIRNKCVFDKESPSLTMVMPPPFWNPPMSENCKGIASSLGMDDVVDRYETFRQTCIPPADLAIWNIAASHQEQHGETEGGGATYMEAAAVAPSTSAGFGAAPSTGDPPTSGLFTKGLFVGMAVAFVSMFGISKIRRRGRPARDDFDSLELADTSRFT